MYERKLSATATENITFRTHPQKGHREHDIENQWQLKSTGEENVFVFRARKQCNKHFSCTGCVRTSRSQIQCRCGYRTTPYSGHADARSEGMTVHEQYHHEWCALSRFVDKFYQVFIDSPQISLIMEYLKEDLYLQSKHRCCYK